MQPSERTLDDAPCFTLLVGLLENVKASAPEDLRAGVSRFLANTEHVTWTVRIIDLNPNKMSQGGPPVDNTKEIFDAASVDAITDTCAFATCP